MDLVLPQCRRIPAPVSPLMMLQDHELAFLAQFMRFIENIKP